MELNRLQTFDGERLTIPSTEIAKDTAGDESRNSVEKRVTGD